MTETGKNTFFFFEVAYFFFPLKWTSLVRSKGKQKQRKTEYEKSLQLTFFIVKRRDKKQTALLEYRSLDPGPKGEYYLQENG